MGIAGEPAYRKASALRAAIAAQISPAAASFLAEVQADEGEQQLDWYGYGPLAGQVLQWVQASEAQRADALQRIEHLHQQFLATAQRLENEAKAAQGTQDGSGRDKQGIAQLLRLAVYYPSHEQIYLVDGQPVITCWGFTRRLQESADKAQVPCPFLYGDKAHAFQPCGVEGEPVYTRADAVRATIAAQISAQKADCLASVQKDPRGERLDWYAPFSGLVTPWAAAGENERDAALQQLEALYQKFDAIAENIEKNANAQHDQRLFARMLRKARQFPGSGQVFLVDGKPVITFWGFTRTGRERADPLQCLREAPAALPPPLAYASPIPGHDDAAPDPLAPAVATEAPLPPAPEAEQDAASPPQPAWASAPVRPRGMRWRKLSWVPVVNK